MKTTPEQRAARKEKRRLRAWRNLLACAERKIRKSRRALQVMEKVLTHHKTIESALEIQHSIRLAN